MKRAPIVVIVFPTERKPTSTRFGGFATRLQKAGGLKDCTVVTVALENLAFSVDEEGNAKVWDTATGHNMARADLVYFKSWESMPEEAGALATYLAHKGIPFIDTAAQGVGVSKLATTMRLWAAGIPVPTTLYVRRADRLLQVLRDGEMAALGEKCIIKDIQGAKGKLNFYGTLADVERILAEHSDAQFICQRFIPNDGDYRIGVYGGVSRFVIKRVGAGDTHLNNTSAGGTATYIPVADMPADLLRLAERTAEAVQLQVAGVDIITDAQTGASYVLEANQGSQIVTGAFVEQNIQAFNEALDELIVHRFAKQTTKPLQVVGRRETVVLPDLGVVSATAKVDTGAYTATIHAKDIHVEQGPDGTEELVFTIMPSSRLATVDGQRREVRISRFFARQVRSSNGQAEYRYSFKTTFRMKGQEFEAYLMPGDRTEMAYPVLVGRRVLRSRFMVNVELDEGRRP